MSTAPILMTPQQRLEVAYMLLQFLEHGAPVGAILAAWAAKILARGG